MNKNININTNINININRKYPTCGNTTVRSVDSDDGYKTKTGGYTVPKGTSIFVHMFSLQVCMCM